MKHMEAVNVLRATKQRVKLVLLRRPTGVSCGVPGMFYFHSCCNPRHRSLFRLLFVSVN